MTEEQIPEDPKSKPSKKEDGSTDKLAVEKSLAAEKPVASKEAPKKPARPKKRPPAEDPNASPWEKKPVAPNWEEADDDPLVQKLRQEVEGAVLSARRMAGELTLEVERSLIRVLCGAVKAEGFDYFTDLCGAHDPSREEAPFEVIYHLYRMADDCRIRLRVRHREGESVPSITSVWRGANWCERETWDLYGTEFSDHPDLTRILTWEGFNGHPLRKDFPLEGIDTGAAIYPERYDEDAGPVAGTGTGWMAPRPNSETAEDEGDLT